VATTSKGRAAAACGTRRAEEEYEEKVLLTCTRLSFLNIIIVGIINIFIESGINMKPKKED
jgi:hypothetical protein